MSHRVDAERPEQVFAEHYGDAAERRGANQDELRPAEDKTSRPAPSFAQIGIEAARFRQRRRELRQRQRAAERDDAADDPQRDHQLGTRHLLRDSCRRSEYARADRDANHERDRTPEPKPPRQAAVCHLWVRSLTHGTDPEDFCI